MIGRYQGVVVEVVARAMTPFIQLFALYVISHGHYGPGGGFQGGVILASSTILLRLALDTKRAYRSFPPGAAVAMAAAGVIVMLTAGLLPLAQGGVLLDYARLPLPAASDAERRALGILVFEVGVACTVWGALVGIVDSLASKSE